MIPPVEDWPEERTGDRTAGCHMLVAVLLVFWLCVVALVKSCVTG